MPVPKKLNALLVERLGAEVADEVAAWLDSLASGWSVFELNQRIWAVDRAMEQRVERLECRLETMLYRLKREM